MFKLFRIIITGSIILAIIGYPCMSHNRIIGTKIVAINHGTTGKYFKLYTTYVVYNSKYFPVDMSYTILNISQ